MTTGSPTRGVAAGWAGLGTLLAVSAGATWLLGLRLLVVAPRSAGEIAAARVEQWVELVILLGGIVLALWMLVGSLAGIACAGLARRRNAPGVVDALGAWAPLVVRRLARGAIGLGVGAGLALTPVAAMADDTPPPSQVTVVELGWQSTDTTPEVSVTEQPETSAEVGPVRPPAPAETTAETTAETRAVNQDAERPLEARRTALMVDGEPEDKRAAEVTVVRGDTLWDIAARHLPQGASDAEIMRETVRWHEANVDVVGDDADLILPGQVLSSP